MSWQIKLSLNNSKQRCCSETNIYYTDLNCTHNLKTAKIKKRKRKRHLINFINIHTHHPFYANTLVLGLRPSSKVLNRYTVTLQHRRVGLLTGNSPLYTNARPQTRTRPSVASRFNSSQLKGILYVLAINHNTILSFSGSLIINLLDSYYYFFSLICYCSLFQKQQVA